MTIPPNRERLQHLARKYLKGTLTVSEQREFDEWFAGEDTDEIIFDIGLTPLEHRQLMLARIHSQAGIVQPEAKQRRLWPRIAAAASVVLICSIGAYWVFQGKPDQQPASQAAQVVQTIQDVAPGGNKAVLTLANGEKVQLNGSKNGLLAKQGGVAIIKRADGQLHYNDDPAAAANGDLFNTVETPRGGKYELTLADGTIAVLDAASSIRYPVAFNGNERSVQITGQVYFEVVHDEHKPFKVSVKGQVVEDLGTIFNINAYDDEPVIKTTLAEGSIGLKTATQYLVLKPGQQAIHTPGSPATKVLTVDVEEALAWKNDNFLFNNEPLESVMRKIARWYDVDIQYQEGFKPRESYLGGLTRYSNVSEVLRVLEITGEVRFKIEGKTIKVLPKSKAK
ncbi:FecR family protein [uncultured Chitinophaga sp.]|jgi:Fe2+-dicitrate sensor, membrane component|uniref:FecR family protein n=1 Tax=uncultured Chitinophaga sp. TaxID=339340 RepID=UPI002626B091|nr:FecR family protein [uncultured Chitinophaga sp.]